MSLCLINEKFGYLFRVISGLKLKVKHNTNMNHTNEFDQIYDETNKVLRLF